MYCTAAVGQRQYIAAGMVQLATASIWGDNMMAVVKVTGTRLTKHNNPAACPSSGTSADLAWRMLELVPCQPGNEVKLQAAEGWLGTQQCQRSPVISDSVITLHVSQTQPGEDTVGREPVRHSRWSPEE